MSTLNQCLGDNYDSCIMHQELSMKTVKDVLDGVKSMNEFKYKT